MDEYIPGSVWVGTPKIARGSVWDRSILLRIVAIKDFSHLKSICVEYFYNSTIFYSSFWTAPEVFMDLTWERSDPQEWYLAMMKGRYDG